MVATLWAALLIQSLWRFLVTLPSTQHYPGTQSVEPHTWVALHNWLCIFCSQCQDFTQPVCQPAVSHRHSHPLGALHLHSVSTVPSCILSLLSCTQSKIKRMAWNYTSTALAIIWVKLFHQFSQSLKHWAIPRSPQRLGSNSKYSTFQLKLFTVFTKNGTREWLTEKKTWWHNCTRIFWWRVFWYERLYGPNPGKFETAVVETGGEKNK